MFKLDVGAFTLGRVLEFRTGRVRFKFDRFWGDNTKMHSLANMDVGIMGHRVTVAVVVPKSFIL